MIPERARKALMKKYYTYLVRSVEQLVKDYPTDATRKLVNRVQLLEADIDCVWEEGAP